MMMDLIALRAFRYGTRELQSGESFSAPENLARFYITVGRARALVEATRAMVAHTDDSAPAGPVLLNATPRLPPRRKVKRRTYKRRDMRAED